ncbi:Starch-binding associating with outer membrane [Mucilaginibacter sp. OK268]|uniref:RagB/SusD family nutrient uptake outer membrane protein n=1 Tax=Mucilaginibacter sp. OK268 TaxID=1881048 RepID=UPI00088CE1DF|nr:RagB/SusD family nutrient uptake outer membrane protein [Mucilaginibacter sp. OK268]SDP50693.1 Starch-binding associating with outer membrane [Mucilaginibacter sp. OK268]
MKSIKYITGCLALCVIFMTSCKKDFLSLTSTDKISNATILSDTTLFEAYVINRYIGVKLQNKEDDNTGFGRGFQWAFWSSLTDESIYNNDDNTWVIQQGHLAPNNLGDAGTLWGRSYRGIRECNYALSVINGLPLSAGHKNRLIGELEFIRAFRYQDLIRNYGGIVLMGDKVTELTDNLQDPSLFNRASITESIAYASSQLDDAASKLPVDNGSTWALGRATKGAALALKSRLLLYAASPLYSAGTWQAAAAAAKAVMDLGKYSLFQGGYRQLFVTPENNNEIIFERLFYPVTAAHLPIETDNGPNSYGGYGGNVPLQNIVDAYQMSNGKAITDPASGYDSQNPYVNRDPRFYATILYNRAPYRNSTVDVFLPGGKDSNQGPNPQNASKTGYYLRKFADDNYPVTGSNQTGAQPWIYFRYAEILLNYAEAQNEVAGPDASVYQAINTIRQRASVNMPILSGLSQDDMRAAIRNERRIELAFEEHRFYDVRRWKIAEQTENVPAYGIAVSVNAANPSGYSYAQKVALTGRSFLQQHYWLPIPLAEIQASNGQLKQNPFYTN